MYLFFTRNELRCLMSRMLKSVLDRRQRGLKPRDSFTHRHFSDDGSLHASQTGLLRCLDLDQIEAGRVWIVNGQDADGEVERGLEVVTRIELLLGNHICWLLGSGSAQGHDMQDAQRGFQAELHVVPIERVFDV